MSHDLQVLAKRQPKAADLDAFLARERAPTADGRLKRGGYLLLAGLDGGHAEVDGPSRIEAEDVPDAANGAIGASGWLVQISVKSPHESAWPLELAVPRARAADGVVYDPQEDRVTWPKGFSPRDPGSGEERITELQLDWYSPLRSNDPALPRLLLDLLTDLAPEALPTRYGSFEPPPYRYQGDRKEQEFVTRWLESSSGWVPSLFWFATQPCLGGSASMSTLLDPDRPRPGKPIIHIGLGYSGKALAREPELVEGVVRLFTSMSRDLSCTYAAASVCRDVILKRGRPWGDSQTEWGPMPRATRWMGLPACPTWLAWFSPPYANLVGPSLSGLTATETGGSLFLRMGTEPMNRDELAGVFPPLPVQLLAHRPNQQSAWEARGRYSMSARPPPSEPALVIP